MLTFCRKSQVPAGQQSWRSAAGFGLQTALLSPARSGIQRKPLVSEPGDALEREADAVADRVLGLPGGALQSRHAGAAPAAPRRASAASAPSMVSALRTASSSGQPLPAALREHFEPRFRHDFSSVRVHTDAQAAQAAKGIGARAFTLGEHMVFGAGEFAPGSQSANRLIAHELAHVVQQRAMPDATGNMLQREAAPATPTERVGTSLWAKGPDGKDLPPSLDDVKQGQVGDCYLMAALGAIVVSDPSKIKQMIRDNGDGTYTVRFHGIGVFSDATQTVTADFAVGKHANDAGRGAFWPALIEKAYTQQKGGLQKVEQGAYPGDAVDDMTNVSASSFDPRDKSEDYILLKVTTALAKKWPVTIFSPTREDGGAEKKAIADGGSGLRFHHAYTVIAVDGPQRRIQLFNPWGHSHPNGTGWVGVDVVRKFFVQCDIND